MMKSKNISVSLASPHEEKGGDGFISARGEREGRGGVK